MMTGLAKGRDGFSLLELMISLVILSLVLSAVLTSVIVMQRSYVDQRERTLRDRETDLAMTELFGGFDDAFYKAYREEWPLEEGYSERRDIYNLYHLINHLNHFGGSYERGVDRVLRRFGG